MNAHGFTDSSASERITQAVQRAEKRTNAEIVVAIRRHASHYLGTSAVCGVAAAGVSLAYLWFAPTVYETRFIPLEVALVAALVIFLTRAIDPLRRVLTPKRVMARALDAASRLLFDTLGVARTKARNGVLVYVGLFEHDVRVVPDEGVEAHVAAVIAGEHVARLRRAVDRRDLDGFVEAIVALGDALAVQFPPTDDDENELSDGPQ